MLCVTILYRCECRQGKIRVRHRSNKAPYTRFVRCTTVDSTGQSTCLVSLSAWLNIHMSRPTFPNNHSIRNSRWSAKPLALPLANSLVSLARCRRPI